MEARVAPQLFPKVPRQRLYEQVAAQVQDLIVSGKLRVGDRLPSEAELSEQFGVSRTVIREATKCLVDRGLLSSEPGRGTFVTTVSPQDLSDSFGLFVRSSDISSRNIMEVRELLEVKVAELAAQRADPRDLQRMREAFERMERDIQDVDEFLKADVDFHTALAEATKNDILLALVNSLVGEFLTVRRTAGNILQGNRNAQEAHTVILRCVSAGDAAAAAQAMRDHLKEVSQRYETYRTARGEPATR